MKNTFIRNLMILTLVIISGAIYAQKKETITITGRVTVKDTGKPPIGIITIAEKGVVDYWANMGESIGTNHHTFVEKDGTFKFTINKGGTIVIQDGGSRYMARTFFKLDKSQSIDVVLSPTKRTNPIPYPANELLPHEKKIDIHQRIKISGKMMYPDGRPMGNATISQGDVYTEQTPGPMAHTTTLKDGTYEYRVLKGGAFSLGAAGYQTQYFTATKDTVINVKMKPANPFK